MYRLQNPYHRPAQIIRPTYQPEGVCYPPTRRCSLPGVCCPFGTYCDGWRCHPNPNTYTSGAGRFDPSMEPPQLPPPEPSEPEPGTPGGEGIPPTGKPVPPKLTSFVPVYQRPGASWLQRRARVRAVNPYMPFGYGRTPMGSHAGYPHRPPPKDPGSLDPNDYPHRPPPKDPGSLDPNDYPKRRERCLPGYATCGNKKIGIACCGKGSSCAYGIDDEGKKYAYCTKKPKRKPQGGKPAPMGPLLKAVNRMLPPPRPGMRGIF